MIHAGYLHRVCGDSSLLDDAASLAEAIENVAVAEVEYPQPHTDDEYQNGSKGRWMLAAAEDESDRGEVDSYCLEPRTCHCGRI